MTSGVGPVNDPVLSDEVVLALVRRHVPVARAVVGVDESGNEARAYFIDNDIVLNVQRPHRVRAYTSLERSGFFMDDWRTMAASLSRVSSGTAASMASSTCA